MIMKLDPFFCTQLNGFKYFYLTQTISFKLSELRWSLMIFIIKGSQTIVFIFIVISTRFQPSSGVCRTREPTWNFEVCPLLNLIPLYSDNQVQVLSIPALLLTCSQD